MMSGSLNQRSRMLKRLSWCWLVLCLAIGGYCLYTADTVFSARTARRAAADGTTDVRIEGVQRTHTTRSIEDIRIGDRVLAHNPEIEDEERIAWVEPDWREWRQFSLEMTQPSGGVLHVEMIRPQRWLELYGIQVGAEFDMDFPEMGAHGPGRVVSVHDCPPIAAGEGQVVTATYAHPPAAAVIDVTFSGDVNPIGVTDNHRFWSVDQELFIPIGEMEIGDRVQTFYGDTKRIEQKLPRPGPQVVYNIEVYAEHVYFVGHGGLLAHNQYGNKRTKRRINLVEAAKRRDVEAFKLKWRVGARSDADYERMGFLTRREFNFWRRMAMERGGSIVISGSKTETPLGMMNRYDPRTRAVMPEFRKRKFQADLIEKRKGDNDYWAGSNLSNRELRQVRDFFPGQDVDAYKLVHYPDEAAFERIGAGAIVFNADGTTRRIVAQWQR